MDPKLTSPLALLAVAMLFAGLDARSEEPVRILLHTGYGTPTAFVLSGRVLEGDAPARPDRTRGRLRNAVETWKAMETDEVEGVGVEVVVGGKVYEARTDDDGVWRVEVAGLAPPLPVGKLPARARLSSRSRRQAPPATGALLVFDDEPAVAVISDFDDTVVESGVANKGRLLYRTFTRNAAQMEPVPGVAAAFSSAAAAGARAFFYVSGSPQNLYERISAFVEVQRLPAGPLLLKNLGEDPLLDPESHKRGRIEGLLATFPRWRFVLVGDSGERDPEIYRSIRDAHPERVAGIVIRRVPGSEAPEGRLEGMTVIDDYAGRADVLAALVRGD